MPKVDKIVAGLILFAILASWIAMLPSAFTARTVDAAPVKLTENAPEPPAKSRRAKEAEAERIEPPQQPRRRRNSEIYGMPSDPDELVTKDGKTLIFLDDRH